MHRRLPSIFAVVSGCLLLFLGACDLQEPDRYIRPPVIKSFSPQASVIGSVVGDSLHFSIAAEDPQGQNLIYRYMLGDSAACMDDEWTYVVEDTGVIDVSGCVSNGVSESVIRWRVTRAPPVNHPPQIADVFPPKPDVSLIVGDVVEFAISAVDPEGKALSYVYTIGGSIVGVTRLFTYEAIVVGVIQVRALVSDGESFASHTWTLHVAAEPDSIPPARVAVLSIGPGPETGEVDVEWVAVGDDSMTGMPAYYVVRTSPVPITDENGWASASDRDGEPLPAPPGEIMRMTVRNLPAASTVYVAVRAMDDFGLISELSALASAKSRGMKIYGVVRNAVTDEPLDGIRVTLVSAADTTDADGSFVLTELPAGQGFIRAQDEPWRTEIGDYFDVQISPYTIRDRDFLNIWMIPNLALETQMYEHLLDFFLQMTVLDGCVEPVLGRWDIPCKIHIPPYEAGGLDYRQTVMDAFLEWENVIGLDVFEFVESVPDTGLYVTYGDPERDFYIIMQRTSSCLPLQGRVNLRTSYTASTESLLNLVAMHEIGHAMRMNHSTDNLHLMYDSPRVDHPSPDEVKLARAAHRIPRGSPARWLLKD